MPSLAELLGQKQPQPTATSTDVVEHQVTENKPIENLPAAPATTAPSAPLVPTISLNDIPGTDDTIPQDTLTTLKQNLSTLHSSLSNPQLVTTALTTVLNTIAANPDLKGQLVPEDGALMVRALQASYSVVHRAKQKRATTRSKSKESTAMVEKMLGDIQL